MTRAAAAVADTEAKSSAIRATATSPPYRGATDAVTSIVRMALTADWVVGPIFGNDSCPKPVASASAISMSSTAIAPPSVASPAER